MDGKKRVPIYELEAKLEKAVKDAGIPKEDFTIGDVSAWIIIIKGKKPLILWPASNIISLCTTIKTIDLEIYSTIVEQSG